MRERMYYCIDLRCSYSKFDPTAIISHHISILHDTSERIKWFVKADAQTEGKHFSLSLTVALHVFSRSLEIFLQGLSDLGLAVRHHSIIHSCRNAGTRISP